MMAVLQLLRSGGSENPLSRLLDGGDSETLTGAEFSSMPDGSRRLVRLLNMTFEAHLYQRGYLWIRNGSEPTSPKKETALV